MTKSGIYKELKEVNKLLWQNDDWMSQESLFKAQSIVTDLLLKVAQDCGNSALDDLVKSFPFLYEVQ